MAIEIMPRGFNPAQTQSRAARFSGKSYDETTRTAEVVISTGEGVRRWFGIERLAISEEAVDLSRVAAGHVRFLDHHNQWSMDGVLGVVEEARIENGALVGRVRFAATEAGERAAQMVKSENLTGISAGYHIPDGGWERLSIDPDTGVETWQASRWELVEVSLVSVPAEKSAGVRSFSTPAAPVNQGGLPMEPENATAAPIPAENATRSAARPAPVPALPTPGTQQSIEAARAEERARVRSLYDIGERAGMSRNEIEQAVDANIGVEAFRARAFDHLAGRISNQPVAQVIRDEGVTRRQAIEDALAHRMARTAPDASSPARSYMGHGLAEMAAEHMGERNMPRTMAQREAIMTRAFHTTSDFPIIFDNAMNRQLASRYQAATPTYRQISRQMTFSDFRQHELVRPGDFPMLQPVSQSGEIKFGSLGEKRERAAVAPYGVQFAITRQMIVNDQLDAIGDVLARQGDTVAQFEERTFYTFFAPGGAGPNLLEPLPNNTTGAMFHANRGNLAGAGTTIDVANLGTARAAMRLFRSVDGTISLNVNPSIILVGPSRELVAQQVVAPIQAQQAGNVNPFSGSLRIIVSAEFAANNNAWYLLAEPSVGANFVWGLLDGYQAPRLRTVEPFGIQGVGISLEHDFGVGAADWRFAYRNPGN